MAAGQLVANDAGSQRLVAASCEVSARRWNRCVERVNAWDTGRRGRRHGVSAGYPPRSSHNFRPVEGTAVPTLSNGKYGLILAMRNRYLDPAPAARRAPSGAPGSPRWTADAQIATQMAE